MSNRWIIDRDKADEFTDPAFLDDVWALALKKFGGQKLSDIGDRAPTEPVYDMCGNVINVGCHVSDGIGGGEVKAVYKDQIWFDATHSLSGKSHGMTFNRPENLMVIPKSRWEAMCRERA